MKFKIKLQSVSDVITNSSSEIYTIKTNVGAQFLRNWWNSKLLTLGYTQEQIDEDDSIGGCIYEDGDGYLVLSYSVMCNVDESISAILRAEFGAYNVSVDN